MSLEPHLLFRWCLESKGCLIAHEAVLERGVISGDTYGPRPTMMEAGQRRLIVEGSG
jgi:hypothetical protein